LTSSLTKRFTSSTKMDCPYSLRIWEAGTLPGRNPGILAFFAWSLIVLSTMWLYSSVVRLTVIFALTSSIFSCDTFINTFYQYCSFLLQKNLPINWSGGGILVRKKGLEPPRLSAPDPKSGAATNYATSAFRIIVPQR